MTPPAKTSATTSHEPCFGLARAVCAWLRAPDWLVRPMAFAIWLALWAVTPLALVLAPIWAAQRLRRGWVERIRESNTAQRKVYSLIP